MFIDSHAHLDYPDFENTRDEVIAKALRAGVKKVISVGTTIDSSKKAVQLSERFKGVVFATAGLHPHDIDETMGFERQLEEIKKIITTEKIVAVGECGLDYSSTHEDDGSTDPYEIKKQRDSFTRQLDLAKEKGLPLIVHSRAAEGDTFEILSQDKYNNLCGVVHCHTGSMDFAKKVLDLGFYIGFTGIITFPSAAELMEVIADVPLDRMLIETDAPSLAPIPYRGQRNEPAYVVEVAKKIAEIKNVTLEEVASATVKNAEDLFGI